MELKEGERIPVVYNVPDIEANKEGIQHGFVFGDGSEYNQKWNTKTRAYVAKGKEEILKYFDNEMTEKRHIHGLPGNYKKVPEITESKEYLLGFIIGLVASDGNVSKSGISISMKNNDDAKKVCNILSTLGIISWENGGKVRNTNYKRNAELTLITIPKPSFKKEWLVREQQKQTYGDKRTEPKSWKVEKVEYTGKYETVYCAVVDGEYKEFALEGNVLTGNCIGCLKAGKQHWYVVYCLRPDIFQEAMKTEEEIGHSIIKGVFLKDLIPKFEETKAKGICPNDKENSSSFWARVEKTLPEQMSFMPCDCSFL